MVSVAIVTWCAVDGCDRRAVCRGWCNHHYENWRLRGNPVPDRPTLAERLFSRVEVKDSGCWLWTGYTLRGYGRIGIGSQVAFVHRVTYEMQVGRIPEGLHLDHLCRVTACCNPDHLEAVTPSENGRREGAARRLRKTA